MFDPNYRAGGRFVGVNEGRMDVEVVPFLGTSRSLSVTTSTARQALTSGTARVSVVAYGCDMAIALGAGTVNAATTDHILQSGERIEFQLRTATETYIAAIALSGSGTLRISELAAV